MPAVYYKVGLAIHDTFNYLNASTFAGTTGKTQGSFTIELEKNGVGHQSTTGITIAEIDSTNNAGAYSVTVDGVTGFSASTGEYTLRIRDTANPQYTWESTYVVTSNGTGNGTWGVTGFTAVIGNGRVTDGTSAILGATVYFTLNSILYASTTSDVNGLWGPIYLSDGTYTVYAQKSGYALVSGIITVSSGTATGPLTDLIMAPVSTGSGLTLGELMSYGRRMIRDSSGAKADTDLKSAINDALGMLSRARTWPWFITPGNFILNGYYNTGTLALTNGSAVVTLSGGTFPTWAASGQLKINGQWHSISTRDSNTQVTMVTAWGEATVASGQAYVVFQDEYALPADCQRFGSLFPGNTWVWQGEPSSYEDVLRTKNAFMYGQKFSGRWGFRKNLLCVAPYPSTNTNLPFTYYRRPANLVNTSDAADWDPQSLEVLQRAIDYQLAIRYGSLPAGDSNKCYERYERALVLAMPNDKTSVRRGDALMIYSDDVRVPGRLIS